MYIVAYHNIKQYSNINNTLIHVISQFYMEQGVLACILKVFS